MQLSLRKYSFLLSFLLLAFVANAQDNGITFEMKLSKEKLGINERLRVDFTMNKDGDNFSPPAFEGFRVLMGPSQYISNSWINGKRSFSKTYTYTLAPTKQGKFTIRQATVVISGKTYKSLPVTVSVSAAVDRPNGEKTVDDIADENLHLVAEVSKSDPFLNEAVTVIYKLYVSPSISVSQFNPLDNPKYNDFWSQDIPVTKYNTKSSTYKGKQFRSIILKRVVLYPQKSGSLEIEPLSLDVTLEVPSAKRDFFGGRIYTQTNKVVSAGKRTLKVKALPVQGKPDNFGGAVGDFNFNVTTSKNSLNATESLQAKVEVAGKGNLKLFQLPEPVLPSSLEVYEPEFKDGVRTTLSGMQGKVSNSYTVVPSFKGKYPIPSIDFSYFNPKTKKYVTLSSGEIMVNVIKGPSSGTVNGTATPSNSKRSVIATGEQFNFIKLKANLSAKATDHFFGSTRFYLWLLLPLLLIPIAILFGKKREAIASDVVGNKIKRANRLAKKYLSDAKKALGNKEAFYIALEKGLHNYLKAKFKIETSEFSKEKIATLLDEKEVDATTKDGFIGLLQNCEMARYSPFSDVQMQQDYSKASEVISYLDKQL